MGKSEGGSSSAMWGCMGTVGAALITGIFGVITVLITHPDFLSERLGGLQSDTSPGVTAPAPDIDWGAVLAQQGDATPDAPAQAEITPNPVAALPAAASCPADARRGWLTYLGTWYGPYDNYYISYDYNYFYIWDAYALNPASATPGNTLYFPSYPIAAARNTWQPLLNTPFWVCIDTPGYVYAVYSPQ